MRRFLLFFLLILATLSIVALLAWTNKKTLLTHYLSNQLHTSVSIQSFDVGKTEIELSQIHITNPRPSKTPTAFTADNLLIQASVSEILSTPLIIEEIDIDQIFVGIEFYNQTGDDNNWSRMLGDQKKEVKNSRPYLIRTLILRNLTVELTKADGQTKRYPVIQKMEFHNISNETGFPIEEIQKAIFKLMLQDLFKQLNLGDLFQGLLPNVPANSPLKLIPGLFK